MAKMPLKIAVVFLLILTALLRGACNGTAAPAEATVIVTVVETVPVEVTRVVEVTQEVIVTEIVEVPVTVTPHPPTATSAPTATPTQPAVAATSTSIIDPQFGITPEGRVHGWLPFYVENKTTEKLEIFVTGPIPFNRVVYAGGSQKVWLREGNYTFTVWEHGQLKYNGTFRITIDEKHHLFLREDKPKLWIP